jgi:hypothetical protein
MRIPAPTPCRGWQRSRGRWISWLSILPKIHDFSRLEKLRVSGYHTLAIRGEKPRLSSVPALKTKTLSVIAYAHEGRSAAVFRKRSRSARDLPQTLAGRIYNLFNMKECQIQNSWNTWGRLVDDQTFKLSRQARSKWRDPLFLVSKQNLNPFFWRI